MTRWRSSSGAPSRWRRLVAAYRAVAEATGPAGAPATGLVLVTGEAGIGKTSLLRRFAAEVEPAGAHRRLGHLLGRPAGARLVAVDRGAARR